MANVFQETLFTISPSFLWALGKVFFLFKGYFVRFWLTYRLRLFFIGPVRDRHTALPFLGKFASLFGCQSQDQYHWHNYTRYWCGYGYTFICLYGESAWRVCERVYVCVPM